MISWVLIALFLTIFIQIILANFTARDAHSRGHDRLVWFTLVLLFGVLSLLIYLLVRNDFRLPEKERPAKRELRAYVRPIGLFGVSAIIGFIILLAVGGVAADAIYPEPDVDCGWEEAVSIYGEEGRAWSCETSEGLQKYLEHDRKQGNVRVAFGVLGFILPPLGIYYKYDLFKV